MRIENQLLALYRGCRVFQSREDFSDGLAGAGRVGDSDDSICFGDSGGLGHVDAGPPGVGGLALSKALTFNNLQISKQPTTLILAGSADSHFVNLLIYNHLRVARAADPRRPGRKSILRQNETTTRSMQTHLKMESDYALGDNQSMLFPCDLFLKYPWMTYYGILNIPDP